MSVEEQALKAYRSDPTEDRLVGLLRTQQDRIYNLCFQVLRHAQDAEDAAQKVLLKLVEGIGALPDVTALRRWLYRVCVTTALDVRTERSRRRTREREVALMKQTGTAPLPEGEGDLLAAIGSLDAEVGDLLIRHYFEKAPLRELATDRRVSEVAIWKRIEKGKERLRELLTAQTPALSMAALDVHLTSIVPAWAPAAMSAAAVAAKAGAGAVLGGMAVGAKTGSTAKIVAACIGLLAAGLGGAIFVQGARARQEALATRDPAEVAAPRHQSGDPRIAAAPASTPLVTAASPPAVVPTPSAPEGGSADAALREKLRTVIRLNLQMKRRVKPDPAADAEARKEMMAIMSEVGPVLQAPSTNPSLFARYTRLSLEVMFEELGTPLAESQKATIAAAVERLQVQLEQFRKDPAQDRWVSELKGYHELIAGMKSLTDEQLGKLAEITSPAYMFPVTGTEIVVLDRVDDPAVEVAREWSRKYQLDDAQKTVAGTAARTFVDAWEQVDRRFEAQYGRRPAAMSTGQSIGSFMDQTSIVVDYAVLTLEAQRETLRVLEGSLTPDQLNRMRNTPMSQFLRAGPVVGAAGPHR